MEGVKVLLVFLLDYKLFMVEILEKVVVVVVFDVVVEE